MMTVNKILSDTVMVVVHCPDIDSYILAHVMAGWTVPYKACTQSCSKEAVLLYEKILRASPSNVEVKKTFRVWHIDSYIYTFVFYFKVNKEDMIRKNRLEGFEAINSTGIREMVNTKLLSPEVLEILDIPEGANTTKPNFIEVVKDDVIVKNSDSKMNCFINDEITESDQLALYSRYVEATFPFLKMDETMTASFMRNLGVTPFSSDHFRAADVSSVGWIDFRGLLGFIATLKGTSKGGLRSSYVFRYYDKDRDEKLSRSEFESMLNEIAAVKPNLNDKKILLESFKDGAVTQDEFSRMIGSLRLRGTSILLVNPTIHSALNNVRVRSESMKTIKDSTSQKSPGRSSLGGHIVTITPDGRSAVTPSQSLVPTISSVETFDGSSPATRVLSALKFFAETNVSNSESRKWYEGEYSDFPNDLRECCNIVKTIFEREQRLLRIDSPVYVIGDVHGRYSDIMTFQKYFWNFGIECCPSSILYLGDYVDRGMNSVEVVSYLFAQKVKNPNKLFLLRGNHETRKVQREHTFLLECNSKFDGGVEVWELMNEVFDRMPLAAVVDDDVFCCHGGIPLPTQCDSLDDINVIPCPLPNPSNSKLAWSLLWNDPQKGGNKTGKADPDGFTKNVRRKTGHTFDKNALNAFIEKHKLSYVVRAHEVQEAGFHIELDNRLITVFSSSNYRGNNNSGCLLVQRNKLRIFTMPSPPLESKPTTPKQSIEVTQ